MVMSMPHRPTVIDALEDRRLFAALTAGVTAQTVVQPTTPNRNYTITLTAGQAVYLAAGEASASDFTTQLVLIGPNHKTVARSVGANGAFIGKVAPSTGTYVVRVRDNSGGHRSAVNVTAFFTGSTIVADGDGNNEGGAAAESGRAFAGGISPGDLDVYSFNNATAGAFMDLVANHNDPGNADGVGVALIAPDGTGVTSSESAAGVSITQTLKQTGTYYAVVYEPGADASGRYRFSVGLAPAVQTTEDPDTQTPLTSGQSRTGALPSGDADVFQSVLGKGVNVDIHVTRTSGTTTPQLSVINAAGQSVGSVVSNNEDPAADPSDTDVVFTTIARGTYYVILTNASPDTGGNYSLAYAVS